MSMLMGLFVRSGHIRLDVGILWNAGTNELNWSDTSTLYVNFTDARAYLIQIGVSGISLLDNYNRWHGLPVRCLASGA